MKNKIIMSIILLLVVLMPIVLAQEQVDEEPKPKIVPGHFLYGLKRAFERIQLILTFDVAAKAQRRLQRAEERIRELQVVQQRNQTQFIEQLTEQHRLHIENAEKDMEKARALGRNVTLLAEHVANMTSKHILVLQRVLLKVPEQAKPAILHAINVSSRGYLKAVARVVEPEKYAPPGAVKEIKEKREKEKGKEAEKYCEQDDDCACGEHVDTGECSYGNKNYVNASQQCPDFCSGIAGNLVVKCINNKCKQIEMEETEEEETQETEDTEKGKAKGAEKGKGNTTPEIEV